MQGNPFLKSDTSFMQKAFYEAQKAYALGEVPVGAVLVHEGQIIARGHNQVERKKQVMAHAELEVLRKASLKLGSWRLGEATLYSTLEPCPMCMGAILLARVKTLVWGAPDIRLGAGGSWVNLLDLKHPYHTLNVRSGVNQRELGALMRAFFEERRKIKRGARPC